jgi:hypothetical protein
MGCVEELGFPQRKKKEAKKKEKGKGLWKVPYQWKSAKNVRIPTDT